VLQEGEKEGENVGGRFGGMGMAKADGFLAFKIVGSCSCD